MVDLSKWVEWVKLAPRYLLAIALGTGVVLFGPANFTVALGLAALPLPVRIAFGIGFLGSTCLLVANWLADMSALAQKEWHRRRELKLLCLRLHNLTPEEQVIMRGYIAGNTRTQELSPEDGVVGGLALERVIYPATERGATFDDWAYNIQPWAWTYLTQHPELLAG
jgi:hypothetical protein